MKDITRRSFLRISGYALGGVVVSTGLQGCLNSSSSSRPDEATLPQRQVSFDHGVASGDPLSDRVIIWTRVSPIGNDTSDIEIQWEVSSTADFAELLHAGSATTGATRDYTLKVDVQNLLPGQQYHYRFRSNGITSAVGRMKTLPSAGVEQVRFAVMSCSNFPTGYFHVYAEAARVADLDAVVHLGDYIYEYGSGGYGTADAAALGRSLPEDNNTETLTLVDYRKRYALYRTDADLQALHASAPFIAVWDDHEITNDTWREGAENHDDDEGDFNERKLAALQAYFEWMPIRPARADDEETIYRSFDYGDLVSLHMLDTRVIGRDEQLDYANYITQSGFDAVAFARDIGDRQRTLLGQEQLDWLQTRLATSTATWQVLGQQVLMGRMLLPAELLTSLLNPGGDLLAAFGELVSIKLRLAAGDPSVTPQERARVETLVPYNLDAWDGYAYEREVVLGTSVALNKNLVVLAGDTHNAWANDLRTLDGTAAGVEFATASVTSPGLEEYLGVPADLIGQTEQAITTLVDDLKYLNANQRGFMVVTFTAEEAQADWHYVSTVKTRQYTLDEARSKTLVTRRGAANRQLSTA